MVRLTLNMGIASIVSVFILCCISGTASAQEKPRKSSADSELEVVLEGFDDEPGMVKENKEIDDVLKGFEESEGAVEESTQKEEEKKPPFCDLSGSLSLGASYSFAHDAPKPGETDYRGLTRLRPDLHLDLDLTISENWKALISGRAFYDLAYEINSRDKYSDEVLDEYEKEAEFGEVYLQGSLLTSLDLKVGRQIVVWGKSDNIRVVDILNPLDNREPGLVDIEDLRLPVTMTKLDYYLGKWNLTAIAVHEIRFNKNPVFRSEFFPSDTRLPGEKEPANTLDNTEYALALNGIFRGWDISFFGARFFDDQPHVEMVSPGHLERQHSRLSMVGMAVNVALGNWLLKSEAAYLKGLEFFAVPGRKKSRLDMLAGVEYSGFTNTTISLEAVNRHIKDFDSTMKAPPDSAQEDEFQTVLRYSGDFLHDSFHVVMLASTFGVTGDDGSLQRFSMEYDIKDDFSVMVGIVTYQSGDKTQFRNIGDNDRLFLEVKYSF